MTMDAEQIVDRRRLRRKLTFWRVVAFLAAALIVVGVGLVAMGGEGLRALAGPHIARVTLSGFISDNREQLELLDRIGKSDSVKGVIIAIDSTGGSTAGGEALYEGIRKLAAKKPTAATIATFGASAAYMAAIATDHIVARRTTITGSIGVLFQFPEVSDLLRNVGVKVEEVKSAPLKAEPSPFKPASEESKQVVAGVVRDSYDWFVDIVAERRDLARSDALVLADGRIFTGRQALAADLVDKIGGEEEARDWLASKGVDRTLPVRDWERDRGETSWFTADAVVLWLARQTGLSPDFAGGGILDHLIPGRLKLDGLISVWQGSLSGDEDPGEGASR